MNRLWKTKYSITTFEYEYRAINTDHWGLVNTT